MLAGGTVWGSLGGDFGRGSPAEPSGKVWALAGEGDKRWVLGGPEDTFFGVGAIQHFQQFLEPSRGYRC